MRGAALKPDERNASTDHSDVEIMRRFELYAPSCEETVSFLTHDGPMLFVDDWETSMRAQKLSKRTITERVRVIKAFGADIGKEPLHAEPKEIMIWFSDHDEEWSQATAAAYRQVLKAWFKWLQIQEHRLDDPMVKVAAIRCPSRLPRPISDQGIAKLLRARMNRKTRAMILLYSLAGLRAFEIAKFRGEHVIDGTHALVKGKGGKEALIPLHPILITHVVPFMPEQGWWFPSDYRMPGQHIHGKSVSDVIGRTMKRAGIKATPHMLRHWYGTTLLDEDVDVRVVQELMRHASLATTALYTKVSPRKQAEAVSVLDPFRWYASPGAPVKKPEA